MSNSVLVSLNTTIPKKSRARLTEIMKKLALPNLDSAMVAMIDAVYESLYEEEEPEETDSSRED